jgi:hypothetical protein
METDRSGKEKRRAGASGATRAALYKRFRKCEQAAMPVNRHSQIPARRLLVTRTAAILPRSRGERPAMSSSELWRAKRLRERVAGLRYTMKTQRLTPMKLAEIERMIKNLEGTAEELERKNKKPRLFG